MKGCLFFLCQSNLLQKQNHTVLWIESFTLIFSCGRSSRDRDDATSKRYKQIYESAYPLTLYISNDRIEFYLKQRRSSGDRDDARANWYKQIYDSAYPFTHGCNPG